MARPFDIQGLKIGPLSWHLFGEMFIYLTSLFGASLLSY
jgi:hypothetical protein